MNRPRGFSMERKTSRSKKTAKRLAAKKVMLAAKAAAHPKKAKKNG